MSSSPSTLHDFVLNLLTDPSAKAAFEFDAQGALEQAGLTDITALDVQQVIPLVLDTLPATPAGLPAVEGVSLEGLPGLEEGPLGAISQLQAVAAQLTSSGVPSLSDINTSSAGVLAADDQGLTVWGGNETLGVFGAGQATVSGDFSIIDDVFGTATSTVAPVSGTALDAFDTATATANSTAATATSLVPGTDSVLGTVGSLGALDTVNGVVHSALGALGDGNVSATSALQVEGLGHSGSGNFEVHSVDTVNTVVDTATSALHTPDVSGALNTVTGLTDTAGVGNVVGNVTDVAHGAGLPAVDHLGVTDLLF
ncbi:IniB N-terminal domain-containing protein [Lentzea sp. NBRC 105346]|uniref:IniB N-terminal domain-containing protein n=1 Tax=Lentzea sp. NBRC 105346 TaxID=3032205 RepID=UPI0025562C07|nr:IniB N-terminal domain-containing protein [Lentzea sp. NBRC 105346]